MKYGTDILGTQKMYALAFGDPLTFFLEYHKIDIQSQLYIVLALISRRYHANVLNHNTAGPRAQLQTFTLVKMHCILSML